MELFILAAVIGLFIYVIHYARKLEIKDWNGGKCSCGGKWKQYDTDSQGGRGYECPLCFKGIWITYHSVDNVKPEVYREVGKP